MTKPLIDDTRFGEDGAGVESTQVTDPAATPSSGLRDTGYLDHSKPTAKVWTRLFNRSHKWFKYLDNLIDSTDNLYHGTRKLQMSGASGVGSNANYGYPLSTAAVANATGCISSTGGTSFVIIIPRHVGDRLVTGGSFDAFGAGVFDITAWSLQLFTSAALTAVTLASGSASAVTATNIPMAIATPVVLTAGKRYQLVVTVNGSNISIGNIDVWYDRPAP